MVSGLDGKVAVVSGGGRGIGRAECLALARRGVRVVVNDLGTGFGGEKGQGDNSAAETVALVREAGGEAVACVEDIASASGAQRTIELATESFGRLDILVNNAGIRRPRMVFKMSVDEWDDVVRVNLRGTFLLIRYASEIFRAQRSGCIVNTASEAGYGLPGNTNYAASKEAILGLTRTLDAELSRYGVRSNSIRPRASTRSSTPEFREAAAKSVEQLGDAAPLPLRVAYDLLHNPEKYPPEKVSEFVVFLCSDEAAQFSGCDFVVGGDVVSLLAPPEPQWTVTVEDGWDAASLGAQCVSRMHESAVVPRTGGESSS